MKYLTKSAQCTDVLTARQRFYGAISAMVCLHICALAPSVLRSQTPRELNPPSSGLVNSMATVYSTLTHKAYTVDSDANSVVVSDDSANAAQGSVHRVRVGAAPVSIGVNQVSGQAYVVNAGDGTVSVIDGKTDEVLATLAVGAHPYSIAVDSVTGKVYVTRTYSDNLMEIDGATRAVVGIKAGSPDLITIDPKTHTVYLLGYEGGSLTAMRGLNHQLSKSSVGMHAWGMAFNPATDSLYIAKTGDARLALVEADQSAPRAIPVGEIPCAVAINSKTNRIYAANYGDNSVSVVDGKSNRTIATIVVGSRPEAIVVDDEHSLIYVANTQSNSVTVIDGLTNKALATLPAGNAPYALAVDSTFQKLHVANLGREAFTTLDVSRFAKTTH